MLISGNGGRLVWDDFPISIEKWEIKWIKPANGMESWRGTVSLSESDLLAMLNEKVTINRSELHSKPAIAEFYKDKKLAYSGKLYFLTYPHFKNPNVRLIGSGKLEKY